MNIEIRKDDELGHFGAFVSDYSTKDGKKVILLNVKAHFEDGFLIDEDGNDFMLSKEDKKRGLIETLMHEFGHALEEHFELDYNEDFIEGVCESYRQQ